MTSEPRRRLSSAERRAVILEAAGDLFGQAPYSEVPTQKIADQSGSSQALIFHYFGSKAGLYSAWVGETMQKLHNTIDAALDELPPNTSSRDKVRTAVEIYLGHVQAQPLSWSLTRRGNDEPPEATNTRLEFQDQMFTKLMGLLDPQSRRGEFAIAGIFGFIDAACLEWVDNDCEADDYYSLLDAILGSLQGALGDWGN